MRTALILTLVVVLAVIVVVAAAGARFDRETAAAVRVLLDGLHRNPQPVIQTSDLITLPPPVRRWLEGSGVVGRSRPSIVKLQQTATMTTAPGGKAMPASAEQYFTLDPPGFVWGVDVTMFGIPVTGRDSYLEGRGGMLIKAAGLWPLVDAHGDAIDQGTLLRFLGELIWFPSAALASYLRWEPIDDDHARVTMTYAGTVASADFTFGPDGRVREMRAQRFYTGDVSPRLETWGDVTTEWKHWGGVLVPSRGEVFWDLKTGRFTYYTWQITNLQYDPTGPALTR